MKKTITLSLVITLLLTCSVMVFGATPVGFGAKAAAMGGAFTAIADDGSAAYWNPAGINQLGVFTLTPGAGIYGIYDPNFNYDALMNNTTFPPTLPNGNLGLPVFVGITTKYAGANVFADINTFMVDNPSYTKMYADGSVYGTMTGAAKFGKLMVGASYKIVKGQIIEYQMLKYDLSDPDLGSKLGIGDNNYQVNATGEGYAVDIGIIYKLSDRIKLGFAGRNLLSSVSWSGTRTEYTAVAPYDTWSETQEPYSATTSLPRTYVAGLAFRPAKTTTIALDVEVITADDADLNQTRYHLGFEQIALWNAVALRLGAFTDKNEKAVGLSVGLGLKAGPVLIDLAAVKAGESNVGIFATAGIKF
jgi:hypothetical protein